MGLSSYEEREGKKKRKLYFSAFKGGCAHKNTFFLSLLTSVPKTSSCYELGSLYADLRKTDGMRFFFFYVI